MDTIGRKKTIQDFEIIGVRKYNVNEEYVRNTYRSTCTDLDVKKTVQI
jgi:dissimilatory sulfite reductase (desulfoviridin) alpha/beta subunit